MLNPEVSLFLSRIHVDLTVCNLTIPTGWGMSHSPTGLQLGVQVMNWLLEQVLRLTQHQHLGFCLQGTILKNPDSAPLPPDLSEYLPDPAA
jgi:hypothetical protein